LCVNKWIPLQNFRVWSCGFRCKFLGVVILDWWNVTKGCQIKMDWNYGTLSVFFFYMKKNEMEFLTRINVVMFHSLLDQSHIIKNINYKSLVILNYLSLKDNHLTTSMQSKIYFFSINLFQVTLHIREPLAESS